MATIVKKLSRLEAAVEAEAEASAALTRLREMRLAGELVTAQECSAAGAELELAELERQGAEEAAVAEAAAARLSALTGLRNEILDRADPQPAIEAAQRIIDAVALLAVALGPERSKAISGQLAAMRALGVAETGRNGQPAPEDAGLSWHGAGMLNSMPRIRVDDRVVMPVDLGALFTALIANGCKRAKIHPQAAQAAGAPQAIAADPAGWLARNI
jgi:hypothetical protein